MLLCCMLCLRLQAQLIPPINQVLPNKSSLFSQLPNRFIVKNSLIENLFSTPASTRVKILLSAGNYFEGIITERVQKNENVLNVNIKSSNYDGALLTLSKISYNDKPDVFIGRIVSLPYGDVLMLSKEKDQFFFTREKQSLVIVE